MSCVVVLAPASGLATTPIYKCLDSNLGVTYTDLPCRDGERMNIRAGDADPAAIARLEREREAIDRRAAQRSAEDRRGVEQRDIATSDALAISPYAIDNGSEYAAPYDSGVAGWYSGYGGQRPHRAHLPKARERRHVASSRSHMTRGR